MKSIRLKMKQSNFVLFCTIVSLAILANPVLSAGSQTLHPALKKGSLRSIDEADPENSPNYMIVQFGYKTSYASGFKNEKRAEISQIKIGDSSLEPNDPFTIEKGAKIEIHFSSHVKSLESFFDRMEDPNVINIISIDLSNFYSKEVISTRLMFYECLNLESIDLSEFSPNALTNMESMFEGCEGLASINISRIPTSNVINAKWMFYGCLSLILIDMSKLNLEKVKEAEFMFYDLPSLEYLDLNESKYSDPIKEQLTSALSNKDKLIVCSEKKIDRNFEYLCCNYSLESHGCEKLQII